MLLFSANRAIGQISDSTETIANETDLSVGWSLSTYGPGYFRDNMVLSGPWVFYRRGRHQLMASYSSWAYNVSDVIYAVEERRNPYVTVAQFEARRIMNYKPHKRSQAYRRYLGLRFGLFFSESGRSPKGGSDIYAHFENTAALDVRYGFKRYFRIGPVATFIDFGLGARFNFEIANPPRPGNVEIIPDLAVGAVIYIDRWLEGILPPTILKP